MKINLFFLLIFFVKLLFGQNLVKNPSFEDYYNPQEDIFYAKDWLIPNKSSIDYYTEKIPLNPTYINFRCQSPYNQYGYHPPYDGIAYAGIILFDWSGEMEHYTGCLKQPLKKDSIYNISFHIRYAGDSVWIYSKKIELLFSKDSNLLWWNTNYRYLFNDEKHQEASIKIDIEKAFITKDWIECTAEYKAQGGEKYVTFGLFYQGDNFIILCDKYVKKYNNFEKQKKFINKHEFYPIYTNKNYKPTLKFRYRVYAYYFLDDVSVTLVNKEKDFTTFPAKK